ncbi:uncharacterized protein KGF55_004515 [Candida pseudojiufengensis]|uniref:uncharacterized protein n=1 Tax=Candida pseudojiufengensis TaxID=497109 RepID=UPI002224E878|nr:uncharacterized protein KGF55_004515 [Candida pseudojiufengensis]KAI5960622.1 hypothetical protein KGF55_004515 [Candida pseudojiufengensis]
MQIRSLRQFSISILRSNHHEFKHSQISDSFRLTMSKIASQAMILTSSTTKEEISQLHGMTLSSCVSLSVYPKPYISFNLHLPSYTSTSLKQSKYCAIHLMSPTTKATEMAKIFARGNKSPKLEENEDGEIFHEMTTPFNEISNMDYEFFKLPENREVEIPILKNGVETIMICKTDKCFPVHDHEIWVIEVLKILNFSNDKTGGLLYYNRGFHKIGKII